MPENTLDFPTCFTEEELAELEGSKLKSVAERKKESLVKKYKTLTERIPEYAQFSLDDYLYCHHISLSRAFGLDIGDKEETCLVPYADMLNHKNPMEARWSFNNKLNGYVMEAVQNIPFGAPIHDSYGLGRETSTLFMNYGFVLHPNDDDDKEIYL